MIAGPGGLLFQFHTGEEYLATGLRVGQPCAALAELMAGLGYGDVDELSDFYVALPADYEGSVPLELVDQDA